MTGIKLKDITTGLNLTGVEPAQIVSVVATIPQGDGALQLIYRTPDGTMKERLLLTADEPAISIASTERPFSFEGKGADFQLACEAKRIDFAFLFDPMMAVHTSNVEPLPHQITAVYESMLPRQPLRFVLADDPGAGKTIMTVASAPGFLPIKRSMYAPLSLQREAHLSGLLRRQSHE